MYIVSACLLGANCKYNGGNNECGAVRDLCEGKKVVAVCPETAGGLKAPRDPAEQVKAPDGTVRVIDCKGNDLTEEFTRGAEICMEKVRAACDMMPPDEEGPVIAVLKANSPSCGSCEIYDGTFTGTICEGDGLFAKLLKEAGIEVITEKELTNDRHQG